MNINELELVHDLFFKQRWFIQHKETHEWIDSFDTEQQARDKYSNIERGNDIDYIE